MNDNNKESVRSLFDTVAARYDLANHLLSLGLDFHWRKNAVALVVLENSRDLLDFCCGTGDFAFSFAKHAPNLKTITACDFSSAMIKIANKKRKPNAAKIRWLVADCLKTPFEDDSFDIVSCAFGVRNMTDLQAGFSEMHRLLRPGGCACILEFSLPRNPILQKLYLLYLMYLLPLFAGIITAEFTAYKHLARSVKHWSENIDLKKELAAAGFENITVKELSFGIVSVHIAHK